MVQVICEKTGVAFEAATKRTKNHPSIMIIVNAAYKDGWYAACLETIKSGREQGWTDIEQFLTALRETERTAKAANDAAYDQRLAEERAAKEARRQRFITNAHLREHGYAWKKFSNDEEDIDFYGAPAVEWDIYSPDGRIVTVTEAMQELAFAGNVFSQKWLAERGIAEAIPAIEVKRREDAAKAAQVQAVVYTQNQLNYQQEAIPVLIAAGLTPEVAEREAKRLSNCTPATDVVRLEPVRLPDGEGALVINSDFRYGVLVDEEWFGIEEIMRAYPDRLAYLAQYAQKNEERSHA